MSNDRTLEKFIKDSTFADTVLGIMPACIKVIDEHANLLYISQKGVDLLELTDPNNALGTNWLNIWIKADREAAKEAMGIAIAGGIGMFEGYYATATGIPKWWDVTITSINPSSNEPKKFLVISKDITDRIENQKEIRNQNKELEKLIKELRRKQLDLDAAESMLEKLLKQSHSGKIIR